jgi:hypothetical protein
MTQNVESSEKSAGKSGLSAGPPARLRFNYKGGRIEVAQRMAGHSNAKTTGLYDRRNDDISVGEVERIGI